MRARSDSRAEPKIRATELDFTARKIQECHDKVNASIERMNDLIPSLEDTLAKVAGLARRFRKSRRKARFWKFSAEALVWLPTLIALATTLICDRATQFAETVTKLWLPRKYHDFVLLLFFGIQVPLLTPFVSRLSDKLCWRAFDDVVETLRPLALESNDIENRISEGERRIRAISETQF